MKNLLLAIVFINFIYGQSQNTTQDCTVPSSYFVGEYYVEDLTATIGPNYGTTNFQSGYVNVTASGNTRGFQTSLFPAFTSNDFTVNLNLNCGLIQIDTIDLGIGCSNNIIYDATDDSNSSTYDLLNDDEFIINYVEDSESSCGGPFMSSFKMTKACNQPENVTFSNVTPTSLDMNWIDTYAGTATVDYTIEYGLSGFSQGSGQTITNILGETYTVDNLQTDTMYDFYIWTNCSGANNSEVLGPFTYGTFVNPVFQLENNGVTCLCPDANFGDSYTLTINGQSQIFTKRTRLQLEEIIENDLNDPEIGLTCTTGIQDFSFLFQNKTTFNQDLSTWDVSNGTTMRGMFYNVVDFNQDIGQWNVSNVNNMSYMFYSDFIPQGPFTMFNQDINNWNVSNVTNMTHMFDNARFFNSPIDNWDVSNLTNMSYMFRRANNFNQPLNSWNVSNVIDMSGTFENAIAFDQPLNNWDVSNVTKMNRMFWSAVNFNQLIDNWNVSNVYDMRDMFLGTFFNQPLNNWDVSNVFYMNSMFYATHNFNQPLNNWDVSNVLDMTAMFLGSEEFNQPLNDWDVSSVNTMQSMFLGSSYNQPLDNWDVSNVDILAGMFGAGSQFNQDISNWCVEHIPSEPQGFSSNLSALEDSNKPNWGASCNLSVVENNVLQNIKFYPNPVRERLNIDFDYNSSQISSLKVFDINGKEILNKLDFDGLPVKIDFSGLENGIYFVKVKSFENQIIKKIVKN